MCACCKGKSALVHVLSTRNRVNLLKDHQSRELPQAVPDAGCIGWDRLLLIRIWTHLKTNSVVFVDGFTWVEGKKAFSTEPSCFPLPFPKPT